MNGETQKVDVLSELLAYGFGQNVPRSTGNIANNLRFRPRSVDGRVVKFKTPTTATVLRMLVNAERKGLVRNVSCGTDIRKTYRDLSASASKERYWVLTDVALARIGGAA